MPQYQFDDGSAIGTDAAGNVYSREIGSDQWVDDALPAPVGWSIFQTDHIEQARMSQGYPANGQSWDANAAMLGVSRLIDSAGRAYANIKGSLPATYAGQNGQTYANGQQVKPSGSMGGLLPLLLIGAVAFAVLR